jgi:hypothetical protein
MNLRIFFLLVFFGLQIYSCNPKPKQNMGNCWIDESVKSKIGFSEKIINFGNLSSDTTVKAIIFIKNVGGTTLFIKEVSLECNCTKYKLENDSILVGDSTRLEIDFKTKGKGSGPQSKAIFIRSNTDKEYNTLVIKYNIITKTTLNL